MARLTIPLLIPFLCPGAVLGSDSGELKNGGFNAGETRPVGWTTETDDGEVRTSRDTSDFVEGKASIRLESVAGAAKGKAFQLLTLVPGRQMRFTGSAKATAGVSYAVVAMVTPDSKPAWHELAVFTQARKWSSFERTWTVPEDADRGLLMLYFTGDGAVWLDDLRLDAGETSTEAVASAVLTDFDSPFSYAYLSFEKNVSHTDGVVFIRAKDGKGGAGLHLAADWSSFGKWSPSIQLKLGKNNKARQIKLQLNDGREGKVNFTYELEAASTTEFRRLLPVDAKPLAGTDFDASNVTGLQIQGTWSGDQVDVSIDQVVFVAPTREMKAARVAALDRERVAAERQKKQAEQRRIARERMLLKGAGHPEDGPSVVHIGSAGHDLLGIEIQAGTIRPAAPKPYTRQLGDEHRPKGDQKLAWLNGKPAIVPAGYELYRKLNPKGRPKKVGELNLQAGTVWAQRLDGAELDLSVVDEPRAYQVTVNGGEAVHPLAVYRKSRPNSIALASGGVMAQHMVYLQLPEPLKENATYEVSLFGINTRQAKTSYTHDSRKRRSEAIHVSYLGYRKSDPFKRAYLSLWTGTGGGRSFDQFNRFQLLSEAGMTVYEGSIRLGIAAQQAEPFSNPKNHSQADVYHLDFSEFQEEGRFVVHVPGLGVSYPFTIHKAAWEEAFKVSMHGFLAHRSGIALGPPFTAYVRPRSMHPDDGFVVFKTDITLWDGEADAIAASLKRLLGPELDMGRLERHPDVWGGYMDAGDWDRRSQHLICSLRHLELLEMFPHLRDLKLQLPPGESANRIPDILDEALWNLGLYRRLQEADGGVGGGVESTAHPRPGEASWQESLLVGSYRPDPETTYRYAAVAARAARLLGDHPLARTYTTSATKAWTWSETNAQAEIESAIERKAKHAQNAEKAVREMKMLAAIELFRLTGDNRYHAACMSTEQSTFEDFDIAMAYALIPESKADARMRNFAIAAIIRGGDAAIDFIEKNGFNIGLAIRHIPMMGYTSIWSTPGSLLPPVLPRAHHLTGDERYLAGAIASCQYSTGANPMNMSYTTGLGERQPLAPLHIDHRISGQRPPAGITVYGQSDPSSGYGFDEFAHTWYLNRYGGVPSQQWPTAEAYIDLGTWPAMNEYTVHQTLSPTSYTWGYLAGRSE